jgi:hypothetical protein
MIMNKSGTGNFKFASWDEAPYSEPEGGTKLTAARVTNDFTGVIEGKSTLTYVLAYLSEMTGEFFGYEQLEGKIGDRAGSFVLQHSGTFDGPKVVADCKVVPGSGAGELTGLSGSGRFISFHGEDSTAYTFEYEL